MLGLFFIILYIFSSMKYSRGVNLNKSYIRSKLRGVVTVSLLS